MRFVVSFACCWAASLLCVNAFVSVGVDTFDLNESADSWPVLPCFWGKEEKAPPDPEPVYRERKIPKSYRDPSKGYVDQEELRKAHKEAQAREQELYEARCFTDKEYVQLAYGEIAEKWEASIDVETQKILDAETKKREKDRKEAQNSRACVKGEHMLFSQDPNMQKAEKQMAQDVNAKIVEKCGQISESTLKFTCESVVSFLFSIYSGQVNNLEQAALYWGDKLAHKALRELGEFMFPGVGGVVVDLTYKGFQSIRHSKGYPEDWGAALKAVLEAAAPLAGAAAGGAIAGAITFGNPIAIAIGGYVGSKLAGYLFGYIWQIPAFVGAEFMARWRQSSARQKAQTAALTGTAEGLARVIFGENFGTVGRVIKSCGKVYGLCLYTKSDGTWEIRDQMDDSLLVSNKRVHTAGKQFFGGLLDRH